MRAQFHEFATGDSGRANVHIVCVFCTHAYTQTHTTATSRLYALQKSEHARVHIMTTATMFTHVSHAHRRTRLLLHTNVRTRRRFYEAADTNVRTHSNGKFRTGDYACSRDYPLNSHDYTTSPPVPQGTQLTTRPPGRCQGTSAVS